MTNTRGWAAHQAKQRLVPYEFDLGPLAAQEVEVAVEYCGLCHSDLSVLNNDWSNSKFPFVPGHEAIGKVVALGEQARGLQVGQRVGIGWTADSCMHCHLCLSGDQNLCAQSQPTMIGHYGAFAQRVRSHWAWAIPVPARLDYIAAGPLLCGGTTVFAPFIHYGVKPTDRVGIVGIGGLGHIGG